MRTHTHTLSSTSDPSAVLVQLVDLHPVLSLLLVDVHCVVVGTHCNLCKDKVLSNMRHRSVITEYCLWRMEALTGEPQLNLCKVRGQTDLKQIFLITLTFP